MLKKFSWNVTMCLLFQLLLGKVDYGRIVK